MLNPKMRRLCRRISRAPATCAWRAPPWGDEFSIAKAGSRRQDTAMSLVKWTCMAGLVALACAGCSSTPEIGTLYPRNPGSKAPAAADGGYVISPYASDQPRLDVRGFPEGTIVRCPYTGQTFTVPPSGEKVGKVPAKTTSVAAPPSAASSHSPVTTAPVPSTVPLPPGFKPSPAGQTQYIFIPKQK